MIKAKEIISIIEVSTKRPYKALFDAVATNIKNNCFPSQVFIKTTISGSYYKIFFDFKLVDTSDIIVIRNECAEFMGGDIVRDRFRISAKDLSNSLGASKLLITLGYFESKYDKYKSLLFVGSSPDGQQLRVGFMFKKQLLDDSVDNPQSLTDTYYRVGSFFDQMLSRALEFKIKHSDPKTREDVESQVLSGIRKKSGMDVHGVQGNINDNEYYLYCFINATNPDDKEQNFIEFISGSLEKLNVVYDGFKKIGATVSSSKHIYSTYSTISTSIEFKGYSNITVSLYDDITLHNLHGFKPNPPHGYITIAICYGYAVELGSLPEDYIKNLIGAISECFVGYKKLINQFVNKPTKKTNEW
jgi:hypothetical protein